MYNRVQIYPSFWDTRRRFPWFYKVLCHVSSMCFCIFSRCHHKLLWLSNLHFLFAKYIPHYFTKEDRMWHNNHSSLLLTFFFVCFGGMVFCWAAVCLILQHIIYNAAQHFCSFLLYLHFLLRQTAIRFLFALL